MLSQLDPQTVGSLTQVHLVICVVTRNSLLITENLLTQPGKVTLGDSVVVKVKSS